MPITFTNDRWFTTAANAAQLSGQSAAAVSFFCREDAGFVSGQVLYVAGGPRA